MYRPIPFLLAAVTFHFRRDRVALLAEVAKPLSLIANRFILVVVTNTLNKDDTQYMHETLSAAGAVPQFMVPTGLGHPYLLTWSHIPLFKKFLSSSEPISHFLYLEDDIVLEPKNIEYWIEGREFLRPHGLIPSFLRVERKDLSAPWVVTDHSRGYRIDDLPFVPQKPGFRFVNLPKPYQGMYLLDRELMTEYFKGPAYNPDFKVPLGGIREAAAQGITFTNVPLGFTSRNLLLCNLDQATVYPDALIHHASNTYAQTPSPGGKGLLQLADLLIKG